ncbi:MAG: restriction endonuclease subunit S [Butyricicoccus sp.]|nr:restriction endonuclease subunit S [Butyricicoccus sp.]MDY4087630.1 restriction endonuclease subunit S [Butyricicoccus intestinisimiae]
MTMIRPETEMKDSGIQWLGNIPKEWSIIKGKYILKQLSRSVLESDNVVTCFRDGEVTLRSNRRELGFTNSLKEIGYQGVEPGDLVVHGMDGFAGAIGISDSRGKMSPIINVLESGECKKYLMYYLRGLAFVNVFLGLSTGIRERSCDLRWNKLANLEYTIPPLSEQQAIADYLDETCSKIDEIIAEAKASIDEYKELKQSVIFEAVTKGLDKNVEMKDSGVEGMGFIPAKWPVVRFMKVNYVRARLGWKGLKAEEYVDVGYPFLAAYHIVNGHLCWENLNCITKERYDESPEIKLSIGDLVLVKDGAGIGKCARIDDMPLGEATVNSSLSVITPNKLLDYRYEYYYFMSPLFQNIIARLKNGMGVPHLTQESMKDIYLPLPSKNEQQAIADYLDNKMIGLDSLIAEKESLINDLEAYKKSLIYEVVTGKRRVV